MGLMKLLVKRMLKTWSKHDKQILSKQLLPDGIIEVSDIPYIKDGSTGHLLDVYYPENVDRKIPFIIDIHGGGFVYGDKELNKSFCYHLAQRGFVVFNLNYRLALNDTNVFGQIQDIMNAIYWISCNIEAYPADKKQAFIMGDSAGSVLAVMAVLITQSKRLQNLFDTKSTNINFKAISIICGMMSFDISKILYRGLCYICFGRGYKRQEYYQNMIFSNIPEMKELPPVFLTTSEEDGLSFMTMEFEKVLIKYSVKYKLKYYSKKANRILGHIFSVQYPEYEESKELLNEMIDFFNATTSIY